MSSPSAERGPEAPARDFIREIVAQDRVSGKHGGTIVTRFPPEPNGRLHIGHAKAIAIDFGIAQEFGGRCNLRFDDTNPVKESQEYVDEIERDIRWLGFDWGEHLYHASDYFEQLYTWAEQLIRDGKAYVDSLNADQMREYRGTLTEPGRESPYRESIRRGEPRSVSPHARRRVRRRRARGAREDRHGVGQHQHARPGHVPDSQDAASADRRRVGASTRCTTGRTASPITSRGSRTRSARSSTRITGRSTTGISKPWACVRRARARSSSRASTSVTR